MLHATKVGLKSCKNVAKHGKNVASQQFYHGEFAIKVKKGARLVISYIGCEPQTLVAAKGMKVELDDENTMSEVVVVGYQTVRKVDLTGAVGVMNMKNPVSEASPNMLNSMQGKISGVQNKVKTYEMLNAQQWGEMYWQAAKNSGQTPSHPLYGNGATPI